MKELRYTLLSDGPSDKALIPALTWLLREHFRGYAIQPEWADLWRLPVSPRGLIERMIKSVELYPCDLLFVHRDAEREPLGTRLAEIREAVAEVRKHFELPPVIGVVPVRMHEAWLLFDEAAIRRAAGNPNGQHTLNLPQTNRVEHLPDPKKNLHDLLRRASGLRGRRLARLPLSRCSHLVSSYIDTFEPLRAVPAFASLEEEIRNLAAQ